MRYFPIYTVILLTAILLIPSFAWTQLNPNEPAYGNNPANGQYLLLNGAKQYFEVYGQGEPLVLIHGNGGNIGYMKPGIQSEKQKQCEGL